MHSLVSSSGLHGPNGPDPAGLHLRSAGAHRNLTPLPAHNREWQKAAITCRVGLRTRARVLTNSVHVLSCPRSTSSRYPWGDTPAAVHKLKLGLSTSMSRQVQPRIVESAARGRQGPAGRLAMQDLHAHSRVHAGASRGLGPVHRRRLCTRVQPCTSVVSL